MKYLKPPWGDSILALNSVSRSADSEAVLSSLEVSVESLSGLSEPSRSLGCPSSEVVSRGVEVSIEAG